MTVLPPAPRAMLATKLHAEQLRIIGDDAWAMQVKIDGFRQLITTGPYGAAGYNRHGVRGILPRDIKAVMDRVTTTAIFDGEIHQDRLYLFDVPYYEGVVDPDMPWVERDLALRDLEPEWGETDLIDVVDHVVAPEAKVDLLSVITETGGEGVVFKRLDSPYINGATTDWLKHKILDDVDAVVYGTGYRGKANLMLAMVDPTGDITLPDGKTVARDIGRVSAKQGDGPKAKIGDVVSVRVGGLGASGRLVEPRKPKIRTDKRPRECTIDQLTELRKIKR